MPLKFIMKILFISIFLFFSICRSEDLSSTLMADVFINNDYNPYFCPDINWQEVMEVSFIDANKNQYKVENFFIIPSVRNINENGKRAKITFTYDHNFSIISTLNQSDEVVKGFTGFKISFTKNGYFICDNHNIKIENKEVIYDISVVKKDENIFYSVIIENPRKKELITLIPKSDIILFNIPRKGEFIPSDQVKERTDQD